MLRSDFHYDLPDELIARHPAPRRSDSRLLHLDGRSGARWRDRAEASASGMVAASSSCLRLRNTPSFTFSPGW